MPCDLVVFTADWIPDHELAAMAGCELDPGTRGPRADSGLRTTVPGVFAAGNVVHPAETADTCGLGGRHVAATVAEHVGSGHGHWPAHVPVHASRPLRWVAPNLVRDDRPPLGNRVLLRSEEFLRAPRIEVEQDGRALWGGRLARLVPGRSAHIPGAGPRRSIPRAGPSAFGWFRGGLDERGQHRSGWLSSGCHSTPSANRPTSSSIASTIPSGSLQPVATMPSPSSSTPWW